MAARTDDDATESRAGVDAAELERYADVTLESGAVVIYDRDNEDAWVQSPSGIGLEFMR